MSYEQLYYLMFVQAVIERYWLPALIVVAVCYAFYRLGVHRGRKK